MKSSIKNLWVAALRDGNYKQTKTQKCLRDKDGAFDALGVLCNLYHKKTGKGKWRKTTVLGKPVTKFLGQTMVLPIEVAEWAGLDSLHLLVDVNFSTKEEKENGTENYTTIAFISDEGWDFGTIATIISALL